MKTLLGLLLLSSAVGCVKNGDLTTDEAKNAGDSLGTGIEDSAKQYGPLSSGAGVDTPCATLSGNIADTDLDNIPASATVTYACTSMALGYTGMLTGTLMVTDDAPTAAAWAFTGAANLHASLTGPLGGSIKRDWTGQIVGTQTTNFGLHRTLDVTTVFTNARNQAVTVSENNDWTITYEPMVTWSPGSVAITGQLIATGTWNVTVGTKMAEATLDTPTPLVLEPNCATRIISGTIKATYQGEKGTHTITVTWSSCGAHTVTYQ